MKEWCRKHPWMTMFMILCTIGGVVDVFEELRKIVAIIIVSL